MPPRPAKRVRTVAVSPPLVQATQRRPINSPQPVPRRRHEPNVATQPNPSSRTVSQLPPTGPPPPYTTMLWGLSDHGAKYLLERFARKHPDIGVAIEAAYLLEQIDGGKYGHDDDDEEEEEEEEADDDDEYDEEYEEGYEEQPAEKQPPGSVPAAINFDGYSKSAWHTLNDSSYSRMRSSKQFEAASDAFDDVMGCIKAIGKQTPSNSAYATKQSALETIRKITKSLLLVGDTLGHEIRGELGHDQTIPTTMIKILEHMTPAERVRVGMSEDEKGTLLDKIRWVRDEAKSYCLDGLNGLDIVLKMMTTV